MRVSRGRRSPAAVAAAILLLGLIPAAARAALAPFTGPSAADTGGSTCAALCTLRQAIEAANANAGEHDTIEFAIVGGPAAIVPGTALPAITDPVTIDGRTQPGT